MISKFRRILVPVDFSEYSRRGLDAALDYAKHLGSAVDLLHVWEPPALRPDLMVWAEADGRPLAELARQHATEELEAFVSSLPAGSIAQHSVASGNPAETIVERARSGGYDLIVIGTHGRTGLPHLLIGSVAEKVVRHAPCPVLTVR